MESLFFALDLVIVAYLVLWAIKKDKEEQENDTK